MQAGFPRIHTKGFTLIELLVVISIIALLSSVVLSALNSSRDKARIAAGQQFSANIFHSIGDKLAGGASFNEGSGSVVADIAGSPNGTISGTVNASTWSTDTPYKSGYSLQFDGSTNYVSLSAGFSDFSSGLTISVWAKPTSNGNWARFMDFGNGANVNNILFARNGTSNILSYEVHNTGTTNVSALGTAIINNEWHLYALTHDTSGKVTIYRDGVVLATGNIPLPGNVTRLYNYIGKSHWGGGDALYAGKMDDFRIYSSSLAAAEIQKIYAEGKSAHQNFAQAFVQ